MDFKVILSPRAIQDLQEIVRYISVDNPGKAEAFGLELIDKTRSLITFPELGRKVPELNDPEVRELIFAPIGSSIAFERPPTQSRFRAFGTALEEYLFHDSIN